VVNAEPGLRAELCRRLQDQGIEPHAFAAGEDALAFLAAEETPVLVVTDIRMTGIDGWQLCRLLRSPDYDRFNAVPILVVSAAFAGDDPVSLAADIGANRFLPAPVNEQDFRETVRDLLSGALATDPPHALVVEDDEALSALISRALSTQGFRVTAAASRRAGEAAIRDHAYHLAAIDYLLTDGKGDALLDALHTAQPDCVCVMMTGHPNPLRALDWMKRGAAACLHKPFDPRYLTEVCARARRERAMLRAADLLDLRIREIRDQDAQYHAEREQAERTLQRTVAQLQKLTGHLQTVREREHRRIAAWLHDDVGQLLTRMRMDVMLLEGLPSGGSEALPILRGLKQMMDDTLDSVRQIAMELRPSVLDDLGLVDALAWSIREDEKRLKFPIQFDVTGVPDALPDGLSVAIYRMARECLTNIVRHAKATCVSVRLAGKGETYSLTVRDNGCGIPPGAMEAPASFGLHQLRERAEAFGGHVHIERHPGGGTLIKLEELRP